MTTTIKLSMELRDRVQQHARRENVSQASVIEHALDLLDREEFFARLRRDVAAEPENSAERSDRESWLAGPLMSSGGDE